MVLILPGGQVDLTATRELREETGFKANQLDFLGEVRPFSKYLSMRSFIYLARRSEFSPLPCNEKYEIGQQRVALRILKT
jgi:8-oxo-dGTP pyrophosphatase MutT (NUDIX family)